jgi:hypothetical protein
MCVGIIFDHYFAFCFREQVIQAELQESGRYRAHIRKETHMFENTEFRTDVTATEYKLANRKAKRKCDNAKKT